nr:RNA-directed DNA polymerase, eukaryota [Tanacetum cinerariifolium]
MWLLDPTWVIVDVDDVLTFSLKVRQQHLLFVKLLNGFKVDFEKAFDSVRWDFLDDVLKKFGFGNKWCDWIRCCLTSSRGSILVNGSPTEEFQFQNGLKQGDPLSPFLFILIMESLHLSFQRVVDSGLFKGLNLNNTVCLSHMFYADDVVFVGKWSVENINTLTNVLDCFHRASGLKINMSKSKIMGVNVDGNKVTRAASKLGCLSLSSPFSYLGTKVGAFMSCEKAWKEVVDKVKNRLTKWKMKALSIGALRGHFFNGHETGSKKASWVKWEKVLAAKDRGGLGVASLFALNREIRRLGATGINIFDFMKQKVGNGNNIKFWTDNWGGSKMEQFQLLVEAANSIFLVPMEDRWEWNLGSSGDFSVASIRRKIDDSRLSTVGDKTRCDLTRNLGRLISNWWNTPFEEVDSIAAWKSWFSSIRLAPNLKLIFEGVWNLTGVVTKDLFLWFPVQGIYVDVPSSGVIYFDVGVVWKRFAVSLFEYPRECVEGEEGEMVMERARGREDKSVSILKQHREGEEQRAVARV